ncbi:CST complex subunit STN1 isoform X2 [Syngnathoides biaculeatus]|uniref:CST complex subunit STN1 isoform X2 n=1 Tax=Syngnathoides biaculeatus TaxID=300417 RepID=UPI002ADE1A66|nr:CST complex subunit STN1 isoform X2 [Syngnathoides biaculeatus]
MDPTEELPSMMWGLDPIFSAFARLHISDILHMRESCQVAVDDATGVINCLCWKNDQMKEELDSVSGSPIDGLQGGFNLTVELKKLRQAQQSHCHLEIGELLRVRGPLKTSRQQREIIAYTYYKVNDPMMTVQIEWMTKVLQLYKDFYDKPLHLQTNTTNEYPISSLTKATNIIKDYLDQSCLSKFRPYDVLDLLQPLITSCTETGPADQQPSMLLKEVLQVLKDEGIVYGRLESQDKVYFVTTQDKNLFMAVKDIIREDSKREKYQEKGCHILHILSAVRQRHSMNVSKAVLELVLKTLECNSDIVSTRDNYFTMF